MGRYSKTASMIFYNAGHALFLIQVKDFFAASQRSGLANIGTIWPQTWGKDNETFSEMVLRSSNDPGGRAGERHNHFSITHGRIRRRSSSQ